MIPPLIGLRFYDHSMGSGDSVDLITCDIVGWLYKEDNLSYYVATWICNGRVIDSNSEAFQVLKSTVVKRYVLSPVEVKSFLKGDPREKKNSVSKVPSRRSRKPKVSEGA